MILVDRWLLECSFPSPVGGEVGGMTDKGVYPLNQVFAPNRADPVFRNRLYAAPVLRAMLVSVVESRFKRPLCCGSLTVSGHKCSNRSTS